MSIKKLSDAAAMMVVAAMVGCSPNDTTVNIALNKAAYASSSYDYNLTAQLVTDGTCFRDKHHKPLGQSSVFCDAKLINFGIIINLWTDLS